MLSLKNVKTHPLLLDDCRISIFCDISLRGEGNHVSAQMLTLAAFSPALALSFRDVPSFPSAVVLVPGASERVIHLLVNFISAGELLCDGGDDYLALLDLMTALQIDYERMCSVTCDGGDGDDTCGVSNATQTIPELNVSQNSVRGCDQETGTLNSPSDSAQQRLCSIDFYESCTPWENNPGANAEYSPSVSVASLVCSKTSLNPPPLSRQSDGRSAGSSVRVKREKPDISAFISDSNHELQPEPVNPLLPSIELNTDPRSASEVLLSCQYCEKCFSSDAYLQRHTRVAHISAGSFACDQCERRFPSSEKLNRHRRCVHEKLRDFACDLCPRSFGTVENLKRHRNSVHLQIKRFRCEICEKSFAQKSQLVMHTRTHTGERPFFCGLCGMSFTTARALTVHEVTHSSQQ